LLHGYQKQLSVFHAARLFLLLPRLKRVNLLQHVSHTLQRQPGPNYFVQILVHPEDQAIQKGAPLLQHTEAVMTLAQMASQRAFHTL
jgi:hypothetical protein